MKTKEEVLKEIEFERNNVLADRSVVGFSYYDDWAQRLAEAKDYKTIISLLHYGLDNDMEGDNFSYSDAVSLYLDYAYGYANYDSFFSKSFDAGSYRVPTQNEKAQRVGQANLKQMVAEKAFSTICLKLFKDTRQGNSFKISYHEPSWWKIIVSEDAKILKKTLEFFSFSKNIPRNVDTHVKEITFDFLYKLAAGAWKNQWKGIFNDEVPEILIENRDIFIKILVDLGETQFFIKHWDLLAKEDLVMLDEISSKLTRFMVSAYQECTLDQALLDNNVIAEAYILIKSKIEKSEKILMSRSEIIEMQKD